MRRTNPNKVNARNHAPSINILRERASAAIESIISIIVVFSKVRF